MTNRVVAAAEQIVADANRDRINASVADVFARINGGGADDLGVEHVTLTDTEVDDLDELWEGSYGDDYDGADDER